MALVQAEGSIVPAVIAFANLIVFCSYLYRLLVNRKLFS